MLGVGMHGCNSISTLFVNVKLGSMGGVIDSRVGISLKNSSHLAAIKKAQAELSDIGRMFAYLYSMSYNVLSANVFFCSKNNLFHVDNR